MSFIIDRNMMEGEKLESKGEGCNETLLEKQDLGATDWFPKGHPTCWRFDSEKQPMVRSFLLGLWSDG